MKFVIAVGCAIALLCPQMLEARLVEDWPMEKLTAAADLIAIAEFVLTEDVDDRPTSEFLKEHGDAVQGQVTKLQVKTVLKGKAPDGMVKVFHFRSKENKKFLNGPNFVHFRLRDPEYSIELHDGDATQAGKTTHVVPGVNRYLLFLKQGSQGR